MSTYILSKFFIKNLHIASGM